MAAALLMATGAVLLLGPDLSLAHVKARQAMLVHSYAAHPVRFIVLFLAAQAAALALLLPGAVLLFALVAGAVMGPVMGTAVVLVALTTGDSLGFLIARYLARDAFERRLGTRLAPILAAVTCDGAAYLLALRLAATIPYFLVNIGMALSRMRLAVFAPVSLVGLAPATILHVNAGARLARITGPGEILTPAVIVSLTALALFPLAMLWLVRRWRGRNGAAPD